MMRSLWAGVTGLQAHQIAMDVEGNNIANVNTTGFKYSRANFSDLLSQTAKIATAPQGELGGKNPMQIGLGTQISSVTKIFKQGSIETTDKNTDLAIQGDGFFVVSPDGGNTYKYSRNGDFSFDASGNFSDSNGYIIQGWMRDKVTGEIDATAPIANITIPPGLTTPANDTGYITLKANLNSGQTTTSKSPIYQLDQYHRWVDTDANGRQDSTEVHNENGTSSADALFDVNKVMYERGEDFGALFNSSGESFNLADGQGIWVSYSDSIYNSTSVSNVSGITVDMMINGIQIGGPTTTYTSASTISSEIQEDNMRFIQDLINQKSSTTGVEATIGAGGITLRNTNQLGTESDTKNIKIVVNTANDDTNLLDIAGGASNTVEIITAFQYTYTPNSASTATSRSEARVFHTTEDLRYAMQTDARTNTDYVGNGWSSAIANLNDGVEIVINSQGQFEVKNPEGDAFNEDDGDIITSLDTSGNPWTLTSANLITEGTYNIAPVGGTAIAAGDVLENITLGADVTLPVGTIYVINGITTTAGAGGDLVTSGTVLSSIDFAGGAGATMPEDTTYILKGTGEAVLTEDTLFPANSALASGADTITLASGMSVTLPEGTTYQNNNSGVVLTAPVGGASITGPFTLSDLTLPATAGTIFPKGTTFLNPATIVQAGTDKKTANDKNITFAVTELTNEATKINANTKFATTMKTLQGALPFGNNLRTSQGIYAASHASSIDVYDSLGSKHTVRFEFRKVGVTNDGGTQWNMIISVPEPGTIGDIYPKNILTGQIQFGSDGSLSSYSPSSLRYTANNGSTPNQAITLEFGTAGQFDGMTSFDKESNTSGISQDGYPGGDLAGIRVDETGTLIGSFTNGRSFGLAQVAMAKFTNNEGLESDGGNTFIQTSNSGDPIIGQAAVGGRGFIQASALEMSNVDLSRSLTQLIVIQRGYQANSKTITTSDQMLNTLLQLKQ